MKSTPVMAQAPVLIVQSPVYSLDRFAAGCARLLQAYADGRRCWGAEHPVAFARQRPCARRRAPALEARGEGRLDVYSIVRPSLKVAGDPDEPCCVRAIACILATGRVARSNG